MLMAGLEVRQMHCRAPPSINMGCWMPMPLGWPAGSNWVDPPKRERKRVVNYAENEYYRNAMAKVVPALPRAELPAVQRS